MIHPTPNSRYANDRNPHDIRLQDVFLNFCRREKIEVSLYCVDQSVRHGRIVGFDLNSIILETDGRQKLIYKSSISVIDPQNDFSYIFHDGGRNEPYRPMVTGLPENYDYSDVMA